MVRKGWRVRAQPSDGGEGGEEGKRPRILAVLSEFQGANANDR